MQRVRQKDFNCLHHIWKKSASGILIYLVYKKQYFLFSIEFQGGGMQSLHFRQKCGENNVLSGQDSNLGFNIAFACCIHTMSCKLSLLRAEIQEKFCNQWEQPECKEHGLTGASRNTCKSRVVWICALPCLNVKNTKIFMSIYRFIHNILYCQVVFFFFSCCDQFLHIFACYCSLSVSATLTLSIKTPLHL